MDISNHKTENLLKIDFQKTGLPALTLSGRLKTESTRHLHSHGYHQVLTVWDGVSLLVDRVRKQPLFGRMMAFIPADLPHRSVVIGDGAGYKSLYLAPELIDPGHSEISIFDTSTLGAALFERINIRRASDMDSDFNRECLDLFLKVLREDIARPANLVRLPEPSNPQNQSVIHFIENNYARRLGDKFTFMIDQVLGYLKAENIPHQWIPHGGQNPDTLLATFPHKLAATRACLGWIGKQSVLITPQYGPRMHLSTILVDMDIPVGEPINESRCGDCRQCMDACPYGYIKGTTWYPGIDRAELFDAFSCSEKRASFIPDIGHKHECGLCLLACPIGAKKSD